MKISMQEVLEKVLLGSPFSEGNEESGVGWVEKFNFNTCRVGERGTIAQYYITTPPTERIHVNNKSKIIKMMNFEHLLSLFLI